MKSAITYLDIYCERASKAGFFAEPFNLFTNIAFIIAAAIIFRLIRKSKIEPQHHWDIYALNLLLVLIGVGSFLAHSFATSWAFAADVIPIYLFVNIYLFSFLIRTCGFIVRRAVVIWFGFQLFVMFFDYFFKPSALYGTIMYIPTYIALLLMMGFLFYKKSIHAKEMLVVVAIWTGSLILRTLDRPLCYSIPIGTHIFWHILNAIVLALLIRILISKNER